jgi:quercetin dioxygenase-like cupin family protein
VIFVLVVVEIRKSSSAQRNGRNVSMETGILATAEGRSIWVIGDRYTIKCDGNDTSGAFALVEAVVPPGSGPPPHIHSRENEAFYILEGELQFHADGRSFTATAGAWVTLAKGSLHHFKNTGPKPARMLIMVTPAGLENFFLEVGREAIEGDTEPVTPTPEDIQKLLHAAPKFGLEIRIPSD